MFLLSTETLSVWILMEVFESNEWKEIDEKKLLETVHRPSETPAKTKGEKISLSPYLPKGQQYPLSLPHTCSIMELERVKTPYLRESSDQTPDLIRDSA